MMRVRVGIELGGLRDVEASDRAIDICAASPDALERARAEPDANVRNFGRDMLKPPVGVMVQEVERVRPDAVLRGQDGYLRVNYERLGLTFQTYDHWRGAHARIAAEH